MIRLSTFNGVGVIVGILRFVTHFFVMLGLTSLPLELQAARARSPLLFKFKLEKGGL